MSSLLWGNPLAWIGAIAVALPLLVHLLATSRARRLPFPTLRFLPASMPAALRARRLEDRGLLALRCLIIIVAAAALAQPWLGFAGREIPAGAGVLAVVVDASDSMSRPTIDGGSALDAARSRARELVDGVARGTVVETVDLAGGVAAAQAWLDANAAGRGEMVEIVVLSDFQRHTVAAGDFARLPEETAIRLLRIETTNVPELALPPLRAGDGGWSAQVTLGEAATTARWRRAPVDAGPSAADIGLAAAAADVAAARAALAAATRIVGVPAEAPPRSVTVVWSGASGAERLQATADRPDAPWMADVLAALPSASTLAATRRGDDLVLFAAAAPGSLESAALIATLRRVLGDNLAELAELEPGSIEDAVLRGWERPAAAAPAPVASDGRWLWLVVLVLLIVEQRLRRDGQPARLETAAAIEGSDVD